MLSRSGVSSVAVAGIAVVLIIVGFAAWTYPRSILTIPVSFAVGADVVQESFTVPLADDAVQVEVSVSSGGALWSAEIARGNTTVFIHRAVQGGQTTYTSDWIILGAGSYNLTFAALGAGELDAQVTIRAKGGFW